MTGTKKKRSKVFKNAGSLMSHDQRKKMFQAFTLYCNNVTATEIAKRLEISPTTLVTWRTTQNWAEGRRLVANGQSATDVFNPIPSTHEAIVEAVGVMREMFQVKGGELVHTALDHLATLTPEQLAEEQMANLERVVRAGAKVFGLDKPDAPIVQGGNTINIGSITSFEHITEFEHVLDVPEEDAIDAEITQAE